MNNLTEDNGHTCVLLCRYLPVEVNFQVFLCVLSLFVVVVVAKSKK